MFGPSSLLIIDATGAPLGTSTNPLPVIPATATPPAAQTATGRWGPDRVLLVTAAQVPTGTPAQPLYVIRIN